MTSLKQLRNMLIRAEDGDESAVLALMKYFNEIIEREGVPEASVLRFFAERFDCIVKGASADKAFGFTKSKGRPRSDEDERDGVLALLIYKNQLAGMSEKEAFEEVSEQFAYSVSVIKRAWDQYKIVMTPECLDDIASVEKILVRQNND